MWLFVAWLWGDWRNWQRYQATILYIILCDLLYNVLTYNHPMWEYSSGLFPNHVTANLEVQFLVYPPAALVYLTRFPQQVSNQVLWVMLWIAIENTVEAVEKWMGIIHYHNGWNFWWSFLFSVGIFTMLRLHFKKPLWAYGLSVILVIILMSIFHVPISQMK